MGYLLPAFIHLKRTNNNAKMGPTILVLSPTRELATQIQDEAVKFSKTSRIACTVSVVFFFFVLLSCISKDIKENYCCTHKFDILKKNIAGTFLFIRFHVALGSFG